MIFLECLGNNHHFCRFLFNIEQNSCSDTWNRYRNNSLICQLILSRRRYVLIFNSIGYCRKTSSHSSSKISSIISSSRRSIKNSNRKVIVTVTAIVTATATTKATVKATLTATATATETKIETVTAIATVTATETNRKSAALNTKSEMTKIIFEITLANWLSDEATFVKGEAWSKTIVPVMIITILNPIYATKAKSRDCSDANYDSSIDFDNKSSN